MKASVSNEQRAAKVLADPRWPSVVGRDPDADGRFFYSVRTTGVYCRPSCPSRHAKPQNVAFHATAADAEMAGFRACRRCKPDQVTMGAAHAAMVAQLCRYIETAEQAPTLEKLAKRAAMSAFHLHRVFKSVTGLTPKAYAAAHRAQRVQQELKRSDTVTSAIYDAGYSSSGRFYAEADQMLGMTPSRYRSGGAEIQIRFAVGECSLGSILVASTARGICSIMIGDDPQALTRELQDRFPKAHLVGGDAEFEQWVAQVIGLVEHPQVGLDLPLDLRGTAFQRRVWQALRKIPVGHTVSYSDIARRVGAPKSVRAVAQAIAANKIAVAIPCHRVIRSDGALSGYRWGVERKRALLDREAQA
jgi:AraC family transcriptional regulator, regulatory protein of adaptative response / methylated-DNA-[protein]-cysteine methyltransferase